jgi:hypothetical protein
VPFFFFFFFYNTFTHAHIYVLFIHACPQAMTGSLAGMYRLTCKSWVDEESNYPLQYQFHVRVPVVDDSLSDVNITTTISPLSLDAIVTT